jgi:hypothetical protein
MTPLNRSLMISQEKKELYRMETSQKKPIIEKKENQPKFIENPLNTKNKSKIN